jgi:hypothetical protein
VAELTGISTKDSPKNYLNKEYISTLNNYLKPCLKNENKNYVIKAINDLGLLGYNNITKIKIFYPFLKNEDKRIVAQTIQSLGNVVSLQKPIEARITLLFKDKEELERLLNSENVKDEYVDAPGDYYMINIDYLSEGDLKILKNIFKKIIPFTKNSDDDIRLFALDAIGKFYKHFTFQEREIIVKIYLGAVDDKNKDIVYNILYKLRDMGTFSKEIIEDLRNKKGLDSNIKESLNETVIFLEKR